MSSNDNTTIYTKMRLMYNRVMHFNIIFVRYGNTHIILQHLTLGFFAYFVYVFFSRSVNYGTLFCNFCTHILIFLYFSEYFVLHNQFFVPRIFFCKKKCTSRYNQMFLIHFFKKN